MFLLPAFLVLFLVVAVPMISAVWLSLLRVRLGPPSGTFLGFRGTFVWLHNFDLQLRDPDVTKVFLQTAIFTTTTVLGSAIVGLTLALLLNERLRLRILWRLLLLTPWAVTPVVAAEVWTRMVDPRYGVVQDVLERAGRHAPILLLADPHLALWTVSAVNIWLRTPFMMVVLLAGLQTIPKDQYEAAAVDGADTFQRFWHVTLPNLKFLLGIACLLESIWTFKTFDLIQIMTGGGPAGATDVLSTLVYRQSFQSFRFGPAAALGVLMTLFMLALVLGYLRSAGRQGAGSAR